MEHGVALVAGFRSWQSHGTLARNAEVRQALTDRLRRLRSVVAEHDNRDYSWPIDVCIAPSEPEHSMRRLPFDPFDGSVPQHHGVSVELSNFRPFSDVREPKRRRPMGVAPHDSEIGDHNNLESAARQILAETLANIEPATGEQRFVCVYQQRDRSFGSIPPRTTHQQLSRIASPGIGTRPGPRHAVERGTPSTEARTPRPDRA